MSALKPIPEVYGDWIEKFRGPWSQAIEQLQIKFGPGIQGVLHPERDPVDVPVLFVERTQIVEVLRFLKETPELGYGFLVDITATDEQPETPRFHVVYQLQSRPSGVRLRIKVRLLDGQPVATATELWAAANWAEREVWDMFGISFDGHPDLRRILMDHRWEGHPLRKDYPLRGYQIFPDSEPPRPELLQ